MVLGPKSIMAEEIRMTRVSAKMLAESQPPPPPPRMATCVMCGKPSVPFFDCLVCREVRAAMPQGAGGAQALWSERFQGQLLLL